MPLVELLEHDVHGAEVGGVGVEDERLAGDADGVGDAGQAGIVLDRLLVGAGSCFSSV